MTETGLSDLLHRASERIDPASVDRILAESLAGGTRRRRRRQLAITAGTGLTVAAVAGLGVVLGTGGSVRGEDPVTTRPASPSATSPGTDSPGDATSYPPGSDTEVPGGPEIPTDRVIASDAQLAATVRDLVADAGTVSGVEVAHVQSAVTGHTADRTRKGRRIDLLLDGMGTSITIQRWDGYSAVGFADPGALAGAGPGELGQRVATTAMEACGGAYQVFPPVTCQPVDGGAVNAGWPSQGAAMPDTYKELVVSLFTDDGWAIQIDSYNTPGEKVGGPLRELPPLTVERSLELAQSPRWFTAR